MNLTLVRSETQAMPRTDDSALIAWEWPEVVHGLDQLIATYGAGRVRQYLEHDTADGNVGYLFTRFGRERVLRAVRNLAAIHVEEF